MDGDARKVFQKNLKIIMKAKHKTQSDISRALHLPLSTVSSWYNGASYPRVDKMQALADYFGISMRDLTDESEASIPLAKRFPVYDLLSCGTGGFVDDQIIDYVVLPAEMFSPSKEYFAQYAKGDSMINAGIKDGSLLIFEKTSDPQNGMIGCFCIDENIATCKRLSISGSQIILIPENPAYSPIIVPPESFRCLGKLAYVVDDRRNG